MAGETYTFDSTQTQIVQNTSNTSLIGKNLEIRYGDVGGAAIADGGIIANQVYLLRTKTITLSSGTIANVELLATISAKYGSIQWIVVNSDTAAKDYALIFHDDAGATAEARKITAGSGTDNPSIHKLGEKIYIFWLNQTANSASQVDISGGAGAEKVHLTYLAASVGTF